MQYFYLFRGTVNLEKNFLSKILIEGTKNLNNCYIVVLIENDMNLNLPYSYKNNELKLDNPDKDIQSNIICFKGKNFIQDFNEILNQHGKYISIKQMYTCLKKMSSNIELLVSHNKLNLKSPIFKTF